MRKRRNWLKTTIAMITLVATVLETGFSSVSVLASELTTEDGIVVNNDAIEESEPASDNDISIEVTSDGADSDSAEAQEPSNEDAAVESAADTDSSNESESDTKTKAEERLEVTDSGIYGSGYDSLTVFVDTEALDNKDKFHIAFSGSGNATYNPVLNDELDKTNGGSYLFEDLEGAEFSVRASASDDVKISYTSKDGNPAIVVESIPAEKILNTKILTASDDSRVSAMAGSGYDSVKVKFDTENISDRTKFKFYVEGVSGATVNGEGATGAITGLSKDADPLTIEKLDEEEFTVYVLPEGDFNIEAVPVATSTEDGIITFEISDVATKRIYEYEDSKIYVRATLEKADAVPDDADFIVTELQPESTKYNYETYMDALNENSDILADAENPEDVEFNEDNTLLYDIGFFVNVDGSKVEYEPAEGTVSFVIQFKDGQLAETKDDKNIGIAHLSLSDSIKDRIDTTADATDFKTADVNVEAVNDTFASSSEETVEFDLGSLSVVAIYEVGHKDDNKLDLQGGPGDDISADTLLGDAWYYGITANTFKMTGGGDGETNFAAKSVVNQNGWSQTGLTDKAGGSKHAKYIIGDYSGNQDLKFKDKMNRTVVVPVGNNFENRLSKENANTVTTYTRVAADTITSTINNMVGYAAQKSAELASNNSVTTEVTADMLQNLNGKKVTVDISSFGAGTFYINADQITPIRDALEQTGQLKIVKNDDQKIVFNFSGDEVYLKKYDINDTNSDNLNDHPDTSLEGSEIDDIIFNMPNATKVYIDIQAGIFLAPKATATITGSCGGWIVADTVDAKCEWHFTNGRIPEPPVGQGELYIPVKKFFYNGQGHWGQGFKFKLEKIDFGWNWSSEIKDTNFADQVITINGGDNEVASGTFNPIVYYSNDGRFNPIGWDINNKKPEGYDDVFEEWYKITEIPPADALPGTVSNIYGTDEYGTDYPCWYLHVYVYRDRETGYVLTAMRTARKDPVDYYKHYSDLPCEEAREIVFYNQYIPVELNGIKKVVLGTEEQSVPAGKFTFNLYEWDGQHSRWASDPMQTVKNGGENGTEISFAPFALPAEGTRVQGNDNAYDYYYLIKEVDCEKPYIKDNGVYVVKIRREKEWYSIGGERKLYRFKDTIKYYHFDSQDKISGVLNDTAAFSMSPFVFTNTIKNPEPGNTVIYGRKDMVNRALTDGEFTFILENTTGANADPNFAQFPGTKDSNGNITVTNTNGKFSFTTRDYTVADLGTAATKEYKYTLREIKPVNDPIEGVKYDESVKTITVTVSRDNDGNIKAENDQGVSEANPVVFTNTYSTKVQFQAKKTYGTTLRANQKKTSFDFDLYEYTNDQFNVVKKDAQNREIHERITVNGETIGSFSQIDYDTVGTHFYTIREDVPTDATAILDAQNNPTGFYKKNGIKYDGRYYRIKVVVAKDTAGINLVPTLYGGYEGETLAPLGDGVLVATPEFTNDYVTVPGKILIDGHKYLTGKDLVKNYKFEFELKPYNTFTEGKIASKAIKMPASQYLTVQNDENGYFAFGNASDEENGYIFFNEETAPGEEYVFAVTEKNTATAVNAQNNNLSKIDYSNLIYLVKVTVSDDNGALTPVRKIYRYTKDENGKPKLETESEITTGGTDFTNIIVDDTEVPVSALKSLVRVDADGTEHTVAINVNKPFTFLLIDADLEKTLPDNKKNEAIIDTKSCGSDGKVTFTNLIYTLADVGDHNYKVVEQHPDGATLGTDGYYTVAGDPYKYSSEVHNFKVTVTYDETNGLVATPDKTTVDFAFKNIYTAMGKYPIYGIKEITGRSYDDSKDPFQAKLFTVINGVESTEPIAVADIKNGGSWSQQILAFFNVTTLKGAFEFNTTDANKVNELCFDASDIGKTYHFRVREYGVAGDVINDPKATREIHLAITDNGDGTLNIDDTGSDLVNDVVYYTNHHIDPTGITFSAEKKMVDKDGNDLAFDKALEGKFEFVLEQKVNGNWTEVQSKDIDEFGKVTFDSISYNKADVEDPNNLTREYRITETRPEGATLDETTGYYVVAGDPYKYSSESYEITVTLKEEANGSNGTKITATPAYSHTYYDKAQKKFTTAALPNAGGAFTVTFRNHYEAEGSVVLFAKKKYESGNITNGQFSFTLYNPDGTVAQDVYNGVTTDIKASTVDATADSDGVANSIATFPAIHYTLDDLTDASRVVDEDGNKAYMKRYYMLEDHDPNATYDAGTKTWHYHGMIYDGRKYNVEVYLYDDKDGEIKAEWRAYEDGTTPKELNAWDKIVRFVTGEDPMHNAEFVNRYEAKARLKLRAHKVMTGGRSLADFADGFFSFTIYDESGKNPIVFAAGNGTNPSPVKVSDGFSDFWTFEYTAAGTYKYVVKEDMPAGATKDNNYTVDGVQYDPTEHPVEVVVTDNNIGSFGIKVGIDGNTPADPMKSVLAPSVVGAPQSNMITYTVGEAVETPEFTNNYDVKPVQIRFDGTKTLTGGPELKAGDFTFVLQRRKVVNGAEVWEKIEEAKNDASGNFIFNPLKYTGTSMMNASGTYDTEKTFTYRVRELDANGNEVTGEFKVNGITYTGKVITINVKVEDIDGELQATIIDTAAPATPLAVQKGENNETVNVGEFVNTYEADGEVSFPVTKLIQGIVEDKDKTFEFKLEEIGNDVDGKKRMAADEIIQIVVPAGTTAGTKEFTTIKFDRNCMKKQADGSVYGTYNFRVTELVAGDAGSTLAADDYKGYTFTKEVYEVTVKVTDNGDGTLNCAKTYAKVSDFDGTKLAGDAAKYDKGTLEFTNKYTAEGQFSFSGIKDMTNKPIKDGDFEFVLKDAAGNEVDRVTTASAGGKTPLKYDSKNKVYTALANFSFPSSTAAAAQNPYFKVDLSDLAGKDANGVAHKFYTLTETYKTKKGGVKYSTAEYKIEVQIKDNGDGTLATAVYATDPEGKVTLISGKDSKGNDINLSDVVKFDNSYDAICIIDPPILRKQMVGKTIDYGEFSFKITGPGLASAGQDKYESIVKNGYAKDGVTKLPEDKKDEIFVGDIEYHVIDLIDPDDPTSLDKFLNGEPMERTFTYYAEEIIPKHTNGIDYSLQELGHQQQKLKLVVTVKDDDNGILHLYNGKGEEVVDLNDKSTPQPYWEADESKFALNDEQMNDIFLNTYNHEASVDIVGVKLLDGRELTDKDKFKFTITDDPKRYEAGQTPKSVTIENTNDGTGKPTVVAFRGKNSKEDLLKGCQDVDFLNYKWGTFETAPGSGKLTIIDERTDPGEFYVYTINEEYYQENGIVNDKAEYKVYVRVFEDKTKVDKNGHHPLAAEIDHIDKNGVRYSDKTFRFTNEFSATGKVTIKGIKYLVDEHDVKQAVPDDQLKKFEFALYQYDDAARTKGKTLVGKTVFADEYGRFAFDIPEYTEKILKNNTDPTKEYDDEKTLYYQVIEIPPTTGTWTNNNSKYESQGIVFDQSKFDIDVTVSLKALADGRYSQNLEVVKKAADGTVLSSDADDIKYVAFKNILIKFKEISGTKTWIDKETDASKRPPVTLHLYSSAVDNGRTSIATYTITAPATEYTFKTDGAGNPLRAYDDNGKPITYNVEEDNIPGYFSEKNGFNFFNSTGDVLISKVDAETGYPLAGATLAVFDGSTEIERWVSGDSAHVLDTAVKAGKTYTLREISAPAGYEIAPDQTFSIPSDGSNITVTMSDKKIVGSVTLIKEDRATRERLAGAQFSLFTDGGTRIYATGSVGSYRSVSTTSNGTFETDATGALTISDLPYGTYYFEETKAPDGYELSSERLGFTILKNGENVEVTYLDPKGVGSVRLRKVNPTGDIRLAGAVFELYSSKPRTVGQAASATIFSDAYFRYGTYRTNSSGEIYVGDLPWDDYYFIEVDAPSGYSVNKDVNGDDLVYTFTVSASSTSATIDLGDIINNPDETTPPPPGVLGERVKKGGVVNGVLGVRAKPTSGVLGERVGPVTGDASNIILWILLLTACVATIVATVLTGKKKKSAK